MKKSIKRMAALTIVVLWGLLIIATLIAAFINNDFTRTIFPGLIFTIIALPIVAYAMQLVYKILRGRKANEADKNLNNANNPNNTK